MPDLTHASGALSMATPLSEGYHPVAQLYDEMCLASGDLRPHWDYLIRSLEALGAEDFQRRCLDVRRLLHENGVTYNVYADPQAEERLWPLDPIPVLLPSTEWSTIEHALIQRAELLDLLLADLYGPQQLIQKGILPPELIYAHPGFLRPCCGVPGLKGFHLPLYAADLARTPDGSVRVIGDRTQAPSGAGYALENRIVLSRVLPSLYRDSHVHRLALFFRALRTTLHHLDPHQQDNPHIVLLTPGPDNETYFEHAFLANYLGYPLVHGSDLVMRDNRVWLNALDGLKPVDVILRRVDSSFCDPLELRPDSLLGTPGLLQAVRLGQVTVVNPLGSSVLENPGLMAYLPALARELLDEELDIPSASTWWCGDPEQRRFVFEHLDRLVIKPILPHPSTSTVFGAALSTQERWALAERIRAEPHLFVGQEHLALSTAPVVAGGHLEPRPMVLRAFAVARDEGYVVMPGGLSRVAPSTDTWVVSNQFGGVSKDVWVLASEPERQVSLLAMTHHPITLMRDGDDVPGRVADDLFWLGRYTERTEGSVRLLREVLLRLLGAEQAPYDESLPLLLRAVTQQTATFPGFVGDGAPQRLQAPESELLGVILDAKRPGSLRYDIDHLVRVGRAVRDRLSSDSSRVINGLNRELRRPCELSAVLEALQRLITLLAAFAGLSGESMSRGQGWRFLEVGRHLERAVHTVTLLQSAFVAAPTSASSIWEALLAVAHSVKTYRRRYRSQVQPGAVLDLLLLDESNPRSVAYQLLRLEELVGALSPAAEHRRSAAGRLTLAALTHVRLFDVASLAAPAALPPGAPPADEAPSLEALLTRLALLLTQLSDELTLRYFSHAESPHQLVRLA
ncbi:MAG TPA: circularly permuted type 2 ATP-grasp protein [Candidatus Margulisiibacteriota bacterium]|nr:circularly permuted type 2 ATP-grasp protein [Candidatus Margulisiibacteriota bacterium]